MPESTLGVSGGVNCALEYLKPTPYDAYLLRNNDTLVPPGTIQCLADSLVAHDWDIVAPVIYKYPQKEDIWARGAYYNRFFGLIPSATSPLFPGRFIISSGCCPADSRAGLSGSRRV
jgi:GT2 family glycosyltransferase